MKWSLPVLFATLCASSPAALADRPQSTYVWADPDKIDIAVPTPDTHVSNVIYLNGCFNSGDCTFSPGYESSVGNKSSIITSTVTLSPFDAGPTAWDAVVECVQKAYSPLNIVVTDQDPSPMPHFEAVVGGYPDEAGMGNDVGGVSPFSCGVINNAITYSFANLYNGYIPEICWTVAQESAHAFGLDHEYLCDDPMTYLSSCGYEKWFRNVDAPCGEFSSRGCSCGGTTQNSFKMMRDHFGAGTATPPTVSMSEPQTGTAVPPGYVVRADAVDDIMVARVELWINSRKIAELNQPPFVFNVPDTVSDGIHLVEVRAYDLYDAVAIASATVLRGQECTASSCADAEACVDGRCVPGPEAEGGLGATCGGNQDCASLLCGDADGEKHCAEKCEVGDGGCPDGFGCMDAGDFGVCWPGYDDGGGCSVAGSTSLAPIWLGLLAAFFLLRRRRQ